MSMQYVRDYYGAPVKRGQLVMQTDGVWTAKLLRVRSCSHYVHAAPVDLMRPTCRFHPYNLAYQTDDGWVRWDEKFRKWVCGPRPQQDKGRAG